MDRLTRSCVLLSLLCPWGSVQAEERTWRDATRRFELEAEYAGFEDGRVKLKLADGREIAVDLQRLSRVDQEFVADQRDLPRDNPFPVDPALGFKCRAADERGRRVALYGGNDRSEAAVEAALKWIVGHQLPDGGWSFLLPNEGCECDGEGSVAARNAATAMALLPLLGAGHTHREGEHQKAVARGLHFLMSQIKITDQGGSLHESGGSMYSHGLATQALCEAYHMTREKDLRRPAQLALDFIASAADPKGGGWRYAPRTPGDTSVTGWQVAALHAGHQAGLDVPPKVVAGATRFLDSVATGDGAYYGYTTPGRGIGTSASGLTSRIRLGWTRKHPGLQAGIEELVKRGPSKTNPYFNYFATEAVFHFGGEPWKQWNSTMRDQLVTSQARRGHAAGSWHEGARDHGSARAGRLYNTSLATLILETYYRSPPLLD